MITRAELYHQFTQKYGREPIISRAPGRINIIGEHTDYNDGFVLPAAVDRFALFAIQANGTDQCKVTALDLDESASFSLGEALAPSSIGWLNYILGVTDGFIQKGVKLSGFDVLFTSDVPVGSGMSSSAALECGLGTGLNELFGAGLSQEEVALVGQRAEHVFVGVKCGIMDQFASVFGRQDQVVKIDCRTQEREYFPADFGSYQVVLIDSKVKHELVDSEYNIRREQCETGVKYLQKRNPQIRALRDATLDDLEAVKTAIDSKVFDRCRYVIEENNRVLQACIQLSHNNIAELGALMFASHEGLSKSYEVSCDELDLLADLARQEEAVIGCRMMGGGFGGCTINLIRRDKVDEVTERILTAYKAQTGIDSVVYKLNIAEGAGVVI